MITRNLTIPFLLSLAAAATGCAAEVVGSPDDDDDGEGPGSGSGSGEVPLTPEGRFAVQSEFDLAANLPGTPGTVVNYFIQATDDPDDPTKFIVEKVIEALPNGSIKNTLAGSVPFVAGYLNDRLLDVAPNFVTRIVEVGDAFGQIAKHFGTLETLEITAGGQATKLVQGVHFTVDNVDLDFMFKDYGIAETTVSGLTVTLEKTGKLTISEHTVGLSYGQVLKLALDKAIIPMIDPSANNLGDILHGAVNCQAVGQYIYEAIDFGSASTFESACNTGLTAAAGSLYHQIDSIDGSALEFSLAGTARGVDRTKDGKMDDIQSGTWAGGLGYAGTPAPLGEAKFFGARM